MGESVVVSLSVELGLLPLMWTVCEMIQFCCLDPETTGHEDSEGFRTVIG